MKGVKYQKFQWSNWTANSIVSDDAHIDNIDVFTGDYNWNENFGEILPQCYKLLKLLLIGLETFILPLQHFGMNMISSNVEVGISLLQNIDF